LVTLLGLSVAVILVIFAFYSIFGLMGTTFAVGNHKEWRELIANPPDYGLESTKVNFASEDGTPIAAWWLSSKRTNREKGTIILIHGSGGNRSSMLSRASFLVKNGYKVLAVDLRAHGESGGNYMGLGYLEAKDVIAGAEYATQHNAPRPIIAMGYSLGGVAALHAASQSNKLDAVISDSAFVSQADLLQRAQRILVKDKNTPLPMKLAIAMTRLPFVEQSVEFSFYLRTRLWLSNRDPKLSALTAVKKLNGKPVLFISGENDEIAPLENAKRMYETADSKMKELGVMYGMDHSTYKPDYEPYEQKSWSFWIASQNQTTGVRRCSQNLSVHYSHSHNP